jgi:hypothetical protein
MRRITMIDAARIEETKKNLRRGNQIGGYSRLFAHAGIVVLFALTVLFSMSAGVASADDEPLPSMTIGYQNGTITYGLIPDVVILNHTGRVMQPRGLVVTAEVKFHVTKEDNNKIDKMIVTLPR